MATRRPLSVVRTELTRPCPPEPVPPRSPASGAQPSAPHSSRQPGCPPGRSSPAPLPFQLPPRPTKCTLSRSPWCPGLCVPAAASPVPVPSLCPPIPSPHDGQGHFLKTHIRSSHFLTIRTPTRCPEVGGTRTLPAPHPPSQHAPGSARSASQPALGLPLHLCPICVCALRSSSSWKVLGAQR